MRNLTIKRTKSFVGCLAKMKTVTFAQHPISDVGQFYSTKGEISKGQRSRLLSS